MNQDIARAPEAKGPKASLGVAMIVRAAEDTLGTAIRSVKPVADQIVVVDTGSEDETPRVATRMGAELYFHPWRDDFSHARNQALRYMRTDWILVLDADEHLDAESQGELRTLLQQAPATTGGYRVRILSPLNDDSGQSVEHRYTRLFRRNTAFVFEGIIHEQIAPSITAAGFAIDDCDVLLHHEGYRHASAEKSERNMRLLTKQQEQQPEDLWTAYHRGMTAFSAGDHTMAMEILRPLFNSASLSEEQQEYAVLRYAQSALAKDMNEEVIELLRQPMDNVHREGLRCFVLGAAYAGIRSYEQSLRHMQKTLESASTLVDMTEIKEYVAALSKVVRQ